MKAIQNQQLGIKPPGHRKRLLQATLEPAAFVSVAWILRSWSTGSLCRSSHIRCDVLKKTAARAESAVFCSPFPQKTERSSGSPENVNPARR
jgi:hypothetical protein